MTIYVITLNNKHHLRPLHHQLPHLVRAQGTVCLHIPDLDNQCVVILILETEFESAIWLNNVLIVYLEPGVAAHLAAGAHLDVPICPVGPCIEAYCHYCISCQCPPITPPVKPPATSVMPQPSFTWVKTGRRFFNWASRLGPHGAAPSVKLLCKDKQNGKKF